LPHRPVKTIPLEHLSIKKADPCFKRSAKIYTLELITKEIAKKTQLFF